MAARTLGMTASSESSFGFWPWRTKIVLHSFHGSMQVQMLTRSSLPGLHTTNSAPDRCCV